MMAGRSTSFITNGDCAAASLRAAGFAEPIIVWRDALHEGPVRSDLSFETWSKLRADFVTQARWAEELEVRSAFEERAALFQQALNQRSVALWFEHDLFDQLQLIELLYWLKQSKVQEITLVQSAHFLSELSSADLQALWATRKMVDAEQLHEGAHAFELFSSQDPRPMLDAAKQGFKCFPFLKAAFLRHCAEFPSPVNGLGLATERTLQVLQYRPLPLKECFQKVQAQESARYLGDLIFVWKLERLCAVKVPLIRRSDNEELNALALRKDPDSLWSAQVQITAAGKDVLDGKQTAIALNGIKEELGGVKLFDDRYWLYDRERLEFSRRGEDDGA